ncbi:MAG: YiiD C-terminal domain-containing protein [Parachlamydiaceae bacterium]|nr:YiiD C-terminal domain-containing protein [Parachlamydiaceae bacterium]
MKDNQGVDPEASLENYLWHQIPISSAMGVQVELATPTRVVIKAPLSNNINHKQTVFGGSLHAVATLACWSLLQVNLLQLKHDNVQIVIASSEIKYLAPVTTDFKAECSMPETSDWKKFIKMLEKKGKARLQLTAHIYQQNQLCVDFSGVFVAIRKNGL